MVKEFKIVLNAPAQGVFFSGSEVSGILVVKVDEPKSYKNIQVTLVGQAHVSWSESSGSGENQTTHTYTSNETYINLRVIVWAKEQVPTQELHAGIHNFPFRFQLPARLPSSFQGTIGWIRYYVEGRIGTGMLKFDHTVKAPITVVEVVDINVSPLQTPLRAEKQKTLCCLLCASAPITLNVELPRHGFCYGDIIPLKVTLENGSSRRLRLRAQLLQVIVYTAQGHHRRPQKVVASITSGQLEPRTTSTWNPEDLVVPGHIKPTLRSCGIISIEYFLRVSAIITWGLNLTFDMAVIIGNVPLHSTTSAPHPVPMMLQSPHFSPQSISSVYPTPAVYPPSHQTPQFGPPKPGFPTVGRGEFESDLPPSYEDFAANPNEFVTTF